MKIIEDNLRYDRERQQNIGDNFDKYNDYINSIFKHNLIEDRLVVVINRINH